MLESLNDYVSFIVLLGIIGVFMYVIFSNFLKNVERSRIKKAMDKREKEQKGE